MTARSKKAAHPKDNAKGRRKKENKELSDLASQLPLPVTVATQLDKASVIRLATAYLKLRRLFPQGLGKKWGEDSSVADDMLPELGKFLNKAFHGFVFVLGADATILYISEEASAQLGFSQVQLTGKCFWSYVHSQDAKELKTVLCFDMDIPASNVGNSVDDDMEIPRNFTIRMKCILPKRQAELAVDRYKVIHCRGYLKLKRKTKLWDGPSSVYYEMIGVVACGHSLSPTPSAEIKLYRLDFMFQTGLNLQFAYIDPRSQKITGYEPTQLQNKSLYKFIHPYDCKQMKQVHETVLTKSQAISSYYRFLTGAGGWIWIQSLCIVINSNKTDQGQSILFINSVLSEREYPSCTFATEQAAMHDSKQCTSSKRSRTSLKNRKKISTHILEDSFLSDRNSRNSFPNETFETQGLVEVPLFESNNIYRLNHASQLIGKSNLQESQPITCSDKLNYDKYTSYFSSIDAHKINEYTSLSRLEPMNNSINFRYESNVEFHASNIMHNSVSELDDSGIEFQNLIMESSPMSSLFTSKNEQVAYYTTLNNVNSSDLENCKFPNPCVDNQILKPSHSNLTNLLLPFTNWNNPTLKSSQDFTIHDGNSDSSLQVSDSVFALNKHALNPTEEVGSYAVNFCDSSSHQNNEINCKDGSDITTSVSIKNCNISLDINQRKNHIDDVSSQGIVLFNKESNNVNSADDTRYCKNSYVPETREQNQTSDHKDCHVSEPFELLPENMHTNFSIIVRNFCNTPNNQIFSSSTMKEDKDQYDVSPNNNGAISTKILPDEENNTLNTICENIAHDFGQCFNKSLDLNNETTSDKEWSPMIVPAADQYITRKDEDDTNIFYALNDLNNDTLSYMNHVTTDISNFPATAKDSFSPINNMSSLIERASPSITVSDNNDKLCTLYDLNNEPTPQILNQTSSNFSSVTNIDQSGNSSTSPNCIGNSINNAVRIPTKDFVHEGTTIDNDYLSYLNDQCMALYSQSVANARSDSASSISLGYGSESSYLGQSSPFSTYGESSFP